MAITETFFICGLCLLLTITVEPGIYFAKLSSRAGFLIYSPLVSVKNPEQAYKFDFAKNSKQLPLPP